MSHTLLGTLPGDRWCLCFTDGEPKALTPSHVVNLQSQVQALVEKAKPCPGHSEPLLPPCLPSGRAR